MYRTIFVRLYTDMYSTVTIALSFSVFSLSLYLSIKESTHTFVILIKVIGSFIKLSTRPKKTKKEKKGGFFSPLSPDIERS